jgi:hypothetical protein
VSTLDFQWIIFSHQGSTEINRYGVKRVLSSAAAHSKDNDGAKFDNLGAITTDALYDKKFDESVTLGHGS